MKLRPFARTDLRVSELCLGTLHFGWKVDKRTSSAILDRFHAAGGNFIQAASGSPVGSAADLLVGTHPESHVGAWLANRRGLRESLVLATRFVVQDRDISDRALASLLRRACERTLRHLRTGHLDLLLCEWSNVLSPPERLLAALAPLVRDGLVRHIGASSFPAWRLADAVADARERSLPDIAAVQDDFSLVCRRRFDTELADFCQAKRLAFLARSPLAGGFLVDAPSPGRAWASAGRENWLRDRFANPRSVSARDVLDAIALGRGVRVAPLALAWVLAHPVVTSAVIGVTSSEQLDRLIEATNLVLSEHELALLEAPAVVPSNALLGGAMPAQPAVATIEYGWSPPAARGAAGVVALNRN